MTYYIKGGSRYNEANPTVWVALTLNGFTDSKYLDSDWKQIDFEGIIDSQDPFWLFGSASGGAKEVEIGLYNDRRIKIDTTGIFGWNGSAWKNLIGVLGGGDLTDLDDVTIDAPADNEVLAYDLGSTTWINQTPAEAGLSPVGHTHVEANITDLDHLTEGEISLANLLEKSHANLTNVTANQHISNLTDIPTRNHNDLANLNAGDSYEHITQTQKDALHAKYTNAEAVAAVLSDDAYLKLVGDTMGGAINMNSNNITGVNTIVTLAVANYDKFRVWTNPAYTIGLMDAMTYGGLNNYAMTFTVYHTVDRGWVWRDDDDAKNDGAMSLTTAGVLTVKGASTFQSSLQVDGNITTGGTVDGVDLLAFKTDYDNKVNQDVRNTAAPTFTGLICNGNIAINIGSTVDGVDISVFKTAFDALDYYTQAQVNDAIDTDIATHEGNPGDINHLTDVQVAALHAKQHAMDNATYHTSSDIATLNSSTTKHGFLKKLDNIATNFMNGQGNWAQPAGEGGGGDAEGIASTDLIFSNDTERTTLSLTYVKLKEITVYRKCSIRLYWQMKSIGFPGTFARSKVYINDIAVGAEKSNDSDVYIVYTENHSLEVGDTIQIYAKTDSSSRACYIQTQRIQGIEYVATGGF